jgi:ribosomal protein S18 acetylase RimI-like enzyme
MSTSLQPPHEPLSADPAGPAGAVLNNPIWATLSGNHRHLAEAAGFAARYREDVSPFVAVADAGDPRSWADLARLLGPGAQFTLAGVREVPQGWSAGRSVGGVQLVATTLRDEPDPEALPLGDDDVPEMLDLVAHAQPGPFRPRTIEMGSYYGIRRAGRLVAMAGERLHPPGFTEISAVCTDAAHRGQGLATRLVRHVAAGIRARGETPFLHAAASNTDAIRLYETIGFTLRRRMLFAMLRVPDDAVDGAAEARA